MNGFIFCGRSSKIATSSCQARETSVLAIHLLQVSMVCIKTLMMRQALAEPNWKNRMEPGDLQALSALNSSHVDTYERFEPNLDERLPLRG
jgi:TnpA family transposase